MCVFKVANSREEYNSNNSSHGRRRRAIWNNNNNNHGDEEDLDSLIASGFDRERENSAIVLALKHVVAGEEAAAISNSLDSSSITSPVFSWGVGDKRARDHELMHFPQSSSSSSSSSGIYIYTLH